MNEPTLSQWVQDQLDDAPDMNAELAQRISRLLFGGGER
jgi:hypothetical protein